MVRPERPVVLFVGGAGRSGSTLLERMLGQVEGFAASGELFHVWRRSFLEDQRCGCGEPFSRCPFWRAVVREARGSRPDLDPGAVVALLERLVRTRHLPRMALPYGTYLREGLRLGEILASFYRAIARAAEARVVVDSSKAVAYAFFLSAFLGSRGAIDLRILHLVRDSRGVAHSWTRKRPRPEIVGRPEWMPRYGPWRAAGDWLRENAFLPWLRRRHPYLRIRYEDLIEHPEDTLRRVIAFAGGRPSPLPFLLPGAVLLPIGHTVSGNPMRFQSGVIPLRLDRAWREEMPRRARAVVTLLTLPWLAAYGYVFPRQGGSPVAEGNAVEG